MYIVEHLRKGELNPKRGEVWRYDKAQDMDVLEQFILLIRWETTRNCTSSDDVEHIFPRVFSSHTHWVKVLSVPLLDADDGYIPQKIASAMPATHPQ